MRSQLFAAALTMLSVGISSCDKEEVYMMLNTNSNDSTYIGQSRVDTIVIDASRIDTIVISRTDTIYVKNDGENEGTEDLSQLKAVDLGLSVKWASANVGASYPWNYGSYFAWGETSPKNSYSRDSYKWYDGTYTSASFGVSKYDLSETGDGLATLEAEDDAATQNLGSDWRTPTADEWSELIDPRNCTVVIMNDFKGSGINGMLVVSNTNGNWIFLPANGYSPSTDLKDGGTCGYYWSSTMAPADYSTGGKCVKYAQTYCQSSASIKLNTSMNSNNTSAYTRYHGMAVRAVYDGEE